jgi:hypothetical protein
MNFKELCDLVDGGAKEIALSEDVVIDEDDTHRALTIREGDVVIDACGHDIINNVGIGHNSFLVSVESGASLTLSNCNFINNAETHDRIIFGSSQTRIILENCSFHDVRGKVIECFAFSTVSLMGCDFRKCSGGLVYARSSLIKIKNSLFNTESTLIINDDGKFEVLASEMDYLKNLVPSLSTIDSRIFVDLDVIPEGYSTFTRLDEMISECDGEISLDEDFIFDGNPELAGGIEIARDNLVVDGKGHIINANGKSRIFNVTADNVTLKNITFIRAFSNDGGAINNTSRGLKIEDCRFEANTACYGGAIFNLGENLNVRQCDFEENHSFDAGGAIFNRAKGCCVDDSYFSGNLNNENIPKPRSMKSDIELEYYCCGGAIYNDEESFMVCRKTGFYRNLSMGSGSAIDNGGDMKLDDCHFDFNYAQAGAAICSWGYLKAKNTSFGENSSKFVTINNIENDGTMELVSCTFDEGIYYEDDGVMWAVVSDDLISLNDEEEYLDAQRYIVETLDYYREDE